MNRERPNCSSRHRWRPQFKHGEIEILTFKWEASHGIVIGDWPIVWYCESVELVRRLARLTIIEDVVCGHHVLVLHDPEASTSESDLELVVAAWANPQESAHGVPAGGYSADRCWHWGSSVMLPNGGRFS